MTNPVGILKANDNVPNPDWVRLKEINDDVKFFDEVYIRCLRQTSPRCIANFLWFVQFEKAFRESEARIRRKEIGVVQNGTDAKNTVV